MPATEIPLFPLNTVLFPGGLLPLQVFEQRYMTMAKTCLRDATPFGVCLIRHGAEVGAPATPVEVGCSARILQWDMQQLGVLKILARGERRFRVSSSSVREDGLVVGRIEFLADEADAPVPEGLGRCRRLLEGIVAEHGERLFAPPFRLESSAWVSARLAEVLPLPAAFKQSLLELDGLPRLEALERLLAEQA
jgi:Lon protease-like protein